LISIKKLSDLLALLNNFIFTDLTSLLRHSPQDPWILHPHAWPVFLICTHKHTDTHARTHARTQPSFKPIQHYYTNAISHYNSLPENSGFKILETVGCDR